ncbi:MAG: hypothetical protein ACYCX4_02765 [Bacillota bacterium]
MTKQASKAPERPWEPNLAIAETREKIVKALNESKLPIGVMALLTREIARDISDQEQMALKVLRGMMPANGPAVPKEEGTQPGA